MKIKFEGRFTVEEFLAAFNEQVPQILSNMTNAKFVSGIHLYIHGENEEMTKVIPIVFDENCQPTEVEGIVRNKNNHKKKRKTRSEADSSSEFNGQTDIDWELLPSTKRSSGMVILKDVRPPVLEDLGAPMTLNNGQIVDIGDAIEHNHFGAGKIIRVIKGGVLYVDFPGVQAQKYLDTRFAQLKKIEA
ncbi:MAG: hypothetical protein K2X81_29470 [Candidatus Obscuribacterales bacterium]|nr:hypothetical protein [Candidatus Obscuribacterales bacterium]